MALFTDGPASSIEDLQGHDTQLLDVANTEGIDVTRKLALAQEEISVELLALLARWESSSMTSRGHHLAHVVITPPLKLWHTFRALELVYRDAYNSQLNDRYAGKRDEYHELAGWAREKLLQNGIGIANDPVHQAALPTVEPAPGGLADGTYYVAVAWTNGAGQEGAPSHPVLIATTGATFRARTSNAPANARGWNVYAGQSAYTMLLQNAAPLALGETWTQPDSLATGKPAGGGQAPAFVRPAPRTLQRG